MLDPTDACGPGGGEPLTPELIGHLVFGLVVGMDEAVLVTNARRRILYANAAVESVFGYDPDALIGETTAVLYDRPEGYEAQSSRFSVEARMRHEPYVMRYRRKDGTPFDGETIAGPVRALSGEVYFVGLVRDVSVRISAETALRRLHDITSDRSLDFAARVEAILRLGCEHFSLPLGIVSRVEGEVYEVRHVRHPDDAIDVGTCFELGRTYCRDTLAAGCPIGFHHAGAGERVDHPAYQDFGLEAYLGAPLMVDGECYGTLNFSSPAPTRAFIGQDLELVRLFAQWLGHELARQRDLDALSRARLEMERAATTDVLTGLPNRRALMSALTRERERSSRYGEPLTVMLLDFDHFKRLNDVHGHEAGDLALQCLAPAARAVLRDVDVIGRWGGEEFLALLPNTAQDQARAIGERVLTAVRTHGLEWQGQRLAVTLSAGAAQLRQDESVDALLRRADAALYAAKKAGRDRICLDGEG